MHCVSGTLRRSVTGVVPGQYKIGNFILNASDRGLGRAEFILDTPLYQLMRYEQFLGCLLKC